MPTVDGPLVALAGMGCSDRLWSRLDLGDRPVIRSTLTEPTLDEQVERLLDELPQRFELAGLSLGGIVALALVRAAPERVSGLTLMSVNPHLPTGIQLNGWRGLRRVLGGKLSARELQASLLPTMLSPAVIDDRPDLVELTLAMADDLGEQTYDSQLQLQSTRIDERPYLGRVCCPTVIISARDDQLCSVAKHREMAELIPGAVLQLIPDCAHLSPVERPEFISASLHRVGG